MSKINFNKLGLKKKENNNKVMKYNDIEIEVKQYLPIEDKLKLLSNVANKALLNSKFYNQIQISVFFILEIISNYTNISFTEKQKEDFVKIYDLIVTNSDFVTELSEALPDEVIQLKNDCNEIIKTIYDYNSSAFGILQSLKSEYDNLDLDIEKLQEKIQDPESLTLLKEIAPLLNLG